MKKRASVNGHAACMAKDTGQSFTFGGSGGIDPSQLSRRTRSKLTLRKKPKVRPAGFPDWKGPE